MFKTLLFWLILVVIVIWIFMKINNARNVASVSAAIDQAYWTERLLQKLWWSDVSYPIIWFGWDFLEPVQVLSLSEYKKDYLYWSSLLSSTEPWLWVEYIIDSKWRKFLTKKISVQDLLWSIDKNVDTINLESLQKVDEILSFKAVKSKIISEIKNTEDSVYDWLQGEIDKSRNIDELVWIMGKGAY